MNLTTVAFNYAMANVLFPDPYYPDTHAAWLRLVESAKEASGKPHTFVCMQANTKKETCLKLFDAQREFLTKYRHTQTTQSGYFL